MTLKNIRVLTSRIIRAQLTPSELNTLVEDFRGYKAGGGLPDLLGRDVPYDHPHTLPIIKNEEVWHLHLADPEQPWPTLQLMQLKKTSDIHLVYCQGGIDQSLYLLMTILSPNAHDQANNNTLMFQLGTMAENFRNRY